MYYSFSIHCKGEWKHLSCMVPEKMSFKNLCNFIRMENSIINIFLSQRFSFLKNLWSSNSMPVSQSHDSGKKILFRKRQDKIFCVVYYVGPILAFSVFYNVNNKYCILHKHIHFYRVKLWLSTLDDPKISSESWILK